MLALTRNLYFSGVLAAISILFAHWLGDFVLQTNEMALNKHKSMRWLSIHVAVYLLPLLGLSLFLFDWQVAVSFVAFNAALHFATDFITSRLAARYRDSPRIFYPIIGFDQFLHAACLLGSFQFIHR